MSKTKNWFIDCVDEIVDALRSGAMVVKLATPCGMVDVNTTLATDAPHIVRYSAERHRSGSHRTRRYDRPNATAEDRWSLFDWVQNRLMDDLPAEPTSDEIDAEVRRLMRDPATARLVAQHGGNPAVLQAQARMFILAQGK